MAREKGKMRGQGGLSSGSGARIKPQWKKGSESGLHF